MKKKKGKVVKKKGKKKEEKTYKVTPPTIGEIAPSLRRFIFSYFKKGEKELGEGNLPPKEEVVEIVGKLFPNSIFSTKGDKHFSYYKSLYFTLRD